MAEGPGDSAARGDPPPPWAQRSVPLGPARWISTGEAVGREVAREDWSAVAFEVLAEVARTAGATITEDDLAWDAEDGSDITTGDPWRNWLGPVLVMVASECIEHGVPLLPALCVAADGQVTHLYADAVQQVLGVRPTDPEGHAAVQRAASHRWATGRR